MMIKGSLQMSITNVKVFLTRYFPSPVKNIRFLGGKWGLKCKISFSGPSKSTSLRETSSDVLIVKIGAGVLAIGRRKNQKTSRVT